MADPSSRVRRGGGQPCVVKGVELACGEGMQGVGGAGGGGSRGCGVGIGEFEVCSYTVGRVRCVVRNREGRVWYGVRL